LGVLCAALNAEGIGGGVLYLLEMLDGVRCVVLGMLEAMEGVHYVLELLGRHALCAVGAGGCALCAALYAIQLLSAILSAIAVPGFLLLFPLDCACGGGARRRR